MKLSTSTNIYFNRPNGSKATIQNSMRLCATAGFTVMDLNFHDCTTFRLPFTNESQWSAWIEDIVQLAQTLGITFCQAHAPFYNFCDKRVSEAEWIDRLVYRSIDCAAMLGAPWLVIHAGTAFDSPTPIHSSQERNREYFLPIIDYATKKGVGIAFENLWDCNIAPLRRYTAYPEELVALVDSFSGAKVGICWDTDHAYLMGQDQVQAIELVGNRLKATHISDCIEPTSDHMLPYCGCIEWEPILQALTRIGYCGDLTYEIHRYTSTMPESIVPTALKYSVAIGKHLIGLTSNQEGELSNGI